MYVVSGFSRTVTVRLKADTTNKRKLLLPFFVQAVQQLTRAIRIIGAHQEFRGTHRETEACHSSQAKQILKTIPAYEEVDLLGLKK